MNRYIQLIFLLTLCVASSYQQGCWWSGCQPKDWAQRGCFPANQWTQSRSEGCSGGDRYYCCPAGGSGGNPSPGGGGGGNPVERGMYSWYGADGKIPPNHPTASGAPFNRNDMAAAHKTISFGRSVRVKNDKTGQTVDVVINDRGPFTPGRILDLTYAAFGRFGNRDDGVVPCSYVFI